MALGLLLVNFSVAKYGGAFMFWEGLKMCLHRHDNQRTLFGIQCNCVINRSDATDTEATKYNIL
jgi:hypothetical protein